jgi:uncharacterized lipoprotein YmbA
MKLISLMIVLLLTGCAETPATHFYVLEPLANKAINSVSNKKHSIGVGPLTIPSLLERQQMLSQRGSNKVKLAEFHQWAEPLKNAILQVTTKNLTVLNTNKVFYSYPWSAYGNVDYRLIIDISRFDSNNDKTAVLEANWAIMSEHNHKVIYNGHSLFTKPLTDNSYSSLAKTLSVLLNEFSEQVSHELARVK